VPDTTTDRPEEVLRIGVLPSPDAIELIIEVPSEVATDELDNTVTEITGDAFEFTIDELPEAETEPGGLDEIELRGN